MDAEGGEFVGVLASDEEEVAGFVDAEGAGGVFGGEGADGGEFAGFGVNFESGDGALLGFAFGAFGVVAVGDVDEFAVGGDVDVGGSSSFFRVAFGECAEALFEGEFTGFEISVPKADAAASFVGGVGFVEGGVKGKVAWFVVAVVCIRAVSFGRIEGRELAVFESKLVDGVWGGVGHIHKAVGGVGDDEVGTGGGRDVLEQFSGQLMIFSDFPSGDFAFAIMGAEESGAGFVDVDGRGAVKAADFIQKFELSILDTYGDQVIYRSILTRFFDAGFHIEVLCIVG